MVSGVAASYDDAAGGVLDAVNEAAGAGREKARILVQHGRKNRAHKEILNRAIGSGSAEARGVAFPALAVTGFGVFSLIDGSDRSIPENLHGIERAPGNNFEFLPRGERNDVAILVNGQEVGQSEKKPVVGCARGCAGGCTRGCAIRRVLSSL